MRKGSRKDKAAFTTEEADKNRIKAAGSILKEECPDDGKEEDNCKEKDHGR
jgi:hypothetical protein